MYSTSSVLLTDFYQLTMLNAYRVHRMHEIAVFELFVRRLPAGRNFLLACGLEQALAYLEDLHFTDEELAWVRAEPRLGPGFADYLAKLRFSGDVYAMPEGRIFFEEEPILAVVAPLPEAQLVETRLINLLQFQSMVAAKAARCVLAAPGKQLVDFGLRRAQGAEAGLLAARAAYVAGFDGTATVLAGARFDIPLYGTMAHSFIQAHDDEAQAFVHFAQLYPKGATLLIDTYDSERAAHKIAALARTLDERNIALGAVRLDSGDLGALAHSVRAILDEAGLNGVHVFASGNLDEHRIAALLRSGAPIDGFGIGTSLVTSADAPSLDAVYKLQEYAGKPRRKRSAAKATWPGRKQVWRRYGADGRMELDLLTPLGEPAPGEPLLQLVMRNGRRLRQPESLAAVRARAASELARLPEPLQRLEQAASPYQVRIADSLRELAAEADRIQAP
jgi:nicotinate phosphoribosyltransferase